MLRCSIQLLKLNAGNTGINTQTMVRSNAQGVTLRCSIWLKYWILNPKSRSEVIAQSNREVLSLYSSLYILQIFYLPVLCALQGLACALCVCLCGGNPNLLSSSFSSSISCSSSDISNDTTIDFSFCSICISESSCYRSRLQQPDSHYSGPISLAPQQAYLPNYRMRLPNAHKCRPYIRSAKAPVRPCISPAVTPSPVSPCSYHTATLVTDPTITALATINPFCYTMIPTTKALASYTTTSVTTILASYATISITTIATDAQPRLPP